MRKVRINRVAEQIAASRIQNTWKKKKKNTDDPTGFPHPGYRKSNSENFPNPYSAPSAAMMARKANEVWDNFPSPLPKVVGRTPSPCEDVRLYPECSVKGAVLGKKSFSISPKSIVKEEGGEEDFQTSSQDGPMYPLRKDLGEVFEAYFRETRSPLGQKKILGEAESEQMAVDFWKTGLGVNYRTKFPYMKDEIDRAKILLNGIGTWTVSYKHGIRGKPAHLPILEDLEKSYQSYRLKWPSNRLCAYSKPFAPDLK